VPDFLYVSALLRGCLAMHAWIDKQAEEWELGSFMQVFGSRPGAAVAALM